MLENIIPINKYTPNEEQYFDNNEIAKIKIRTKKIGIFNVYYLFNQYDIEFVDTIYLIKKSGLYSLIPYLFAILESKLFTKVINIQQNYIIVFVPTDPLRFVERGFGLNEELMKLAKKKNYRVIDVLIKTKHTKNQSQISNKEMRIIEKDTYLLLLDNPQILKNVDKIYIFDDYITTGNTLSSIAELFAPYNIDIEFISLVGE